jgi:TolA-binding protein
VVLPPLPGFSMRSSIRRLLSPITLVVVLLLVSAGPRAAAASAGERRAFDAASRDFNTGFYTRAETNFAAFAATFTNSTRLPEAVLYQAEARLKLTNFDGAIELLSSHQSQAGEWADRYVYWLGEARFGKGDFAGARDAYAQLTRDFPDSSLRLTAVVSSAAASAKLDQWPQVIGLLEQTNGVFQGVVRTNLVDEWVQRGFLLLVEAHLAEKEYRAAEDALQPPSGLWVNSELGWQGQYLACRIKLAAGHPEEALRETTNLVNLATKAAQPNLQAESVAFLAGILESQGRLHDAILAYTDNLSEQIPAARQREALLKITELSLAQGELAAAAQRMEEFLNRFPQAAAADLACLTLGELRLRQYEEMPRTNQVSTAGTNAPEAAGRLQRAIDSFNTLVTKYPRSALLGKAQLDLGRCYWLDARFPESQAAFQSAVERLPDGSADQAQACFRLAEAEFQQTNYAGAITHYTAIIKEFAGLPEVKTNLFEPALYQTVRAGVAAGDLNTMTNALLKLLAWYPDGFQTDRAVLLAGQGIGRQGDPAGARAIFLSFIDRATNAPLLPEVGLAIARTYEQEKRWDDAVAEYDRWLERFTNAPARPRAEYYRGLASFYGGRETNAFTCFTNLITRFPTNELTPRAQLWTADFYFGRGDYTNAESGYQSLYVNWPGSDLAWQALMMAGRSAVARQALTQARDYFTNLCLAPKCPPHLRAQAWFALGDTYMSMGDAAQDPTNQLANFGEAIKAFEYIALYYTNDPLTVLALGEKANCLLQTAKTEADYANAFDAYRQVADSSRAGVSARSQAKVGMAVVLEKQADEETAANKAELLKQALDHCLDVFHGNNFLRDNETLDPFWTKRAGLEAARLAEALKEWSQAINLYDELEKQMPFLKASLENKKQQAAKNLLPVAE